MTGLRRPAGFVLIVLGFAEFARKVWAVSSTPELLQGTKLSSTIGEFIVIAIAVAVAVWLLANQGLKRPDTHRPAVLVCNKCGRMADLHASHCAFCGGPLHAA